MRCTGNCVGEPAAPPTEDGATAGGAPVLDVRHLDPPGPMVSILRRIEDPAQGGRPFVVRLRRDPVNLYPELDARGWTWTSVPAPPGEVWLALRPARSEGEAA